MDMESLELLHHFVTHVCDETFTTDVVKQVYKVEIPKIATGHGYLMHAILALSAKHLAGTSIERREELEIIATAHQEAGLSQFRGQVENMDPDDSESLFAFARLQVILSYLLWKDSYLEDADRGLELSKSIQYILDTTAESAKTGPLAPLVYENDMPDSESESSRTLDSPETDGSEQDSNLDGAFGSLLNACRTVWRLSDEDKAMYALLIKDLHRCHVKLERVRDHNESSIEGLTLLQWLASSLPDQFLLCFRRRKPEALVVYSYYCAGVCHLKRVWYAERRVAHTLAEIERRLPGGWDGWLNWPREMSAAQEG